MSRNRGHHRRPHEVDHPRDRVRLYLQVMLDLAAWAVDDARAWWSELPKAREDAIESEPTERTQLPVNVEGRR